MTPDEIINALRGIVNTTSLCSIPTQDKVKIRTLLRIIELCLISSRASSEASR